jgi:hypothetical protein
MHYGSPNMSSPGRCHTVRPHCLMEIIEDRRFADLGGTVLGGSPTEFGNLIVEETEKWGKVIRAANIKPE